MPGFWVTFTAGPSGYCEGADIEAAKTKAVEVTGREVREAKRLPYPAMPIIHQDSTCPPFCYKPTVSTTINDIRKAAGDEVAADFIHDLAQDAERYYRGEQFVQCTCAPSHEYKMRDAKCPQYVAQLEAVLREIRETGFIRNTAHKLRERIDAVLPRSA